MDDYREFQEKAYEKSRSLIEKNNIKERDFSEWVPLADEWETGVELVKKQRLDVE